MICACARIRLAFIDFSSSLYLHKLFQMAHFLEFFFSSYVCVGNFHFVGKLQTRLFISILNLNEDEEKNRIAWDYIQMSIAPRFMQRKTNRQFKCLKWIQEPHGSIKITQEWIRLGWQISDDFPEKIAYKTFKLYCNWNCNENAIYFQVNYTEVNI